MKRVPIELEEKETKEINNEVLFIYKNIIDKFILKNRSLF